MLSEYELRAIRQLEGTIQELRRSNDLLHKFHDMLHRHDPMKGIEQPRDEEKEEWEQT